MDSFTPGSNNAIAIVIGANHGFRAVSPHVSGVPFGSASLWQLFMRHRQFLPDTSSDSTWKHPKNKPVRIGTFAKSNQDIRASAFLKAPVNLQNSAFVLFFRM